MNQLEHADLRCITNDVQSVSRNNDEQLKLNLFCLLQVAGFVVNPKKAGKQFQSGVLVPIE